MNNNRTMLVIILTVALFVEGTIAAHNPSVRYFRKDVYHAATQNWDVACTPDRFTFFANNDGVLMFDSGEWTLFRNRNRTNVRSLYYDRDNAFFMSVLRMNSARLNLDWIVVRLRSIVRCLIRSM